MTPMSPFSNSTLHPATPRMPHQERGARDTGMCDMLGLESAHSCLSLGVEVKSMRKHCWIGGSYNIRFLAYGVARSSINMGITRY